MTLGELRTTLAMITDLPDTAIVMLDVEDKFYGELETVTWDDELPDDADGPLCVWLNANVPK